MKNILLPIMMIAAASTISFTASGDDKFSQRDRNRDGYIDRADISPKGRFSKKGKILTSMIRRMDADGDKRISYMEFFRAQNLRKK